ncbi:MAG: T9SS type A sorting domain-containing protein [Salinivirgaceae bacterium]|nr:T9SS type A sorting domain-containing protein [Salinivirgaceae bacterium]
MKKSILIALAVALTTGAQAQVDEWVNPFEKYGAYDYVQKQSKHYYGKWFLKTSYLDTTKWNKYPTLVNYNNETFVQMSDSYYAIAIVFNKPYYVDEHNINVDLKYNAIHLNSNGEKTDMDFLSASIYFIKETVKKEDIFNKIEYCYKYKSDLNSSANGTLVTVNGSDCEYICIVLSGTNISKNGYCLINNIEITIRDNEDNFPYKYFYEPYYMDNEGNIHSKSENWVLPTSINDNDMESNIYVSNNVLHTDEPSSVYIFNAGGVLVKTEHNVTSVDISDLKKGVYIAKVNGKPVRFIQ